MNVIAGNLVSLGADIGASVGQSAVSGNGLTGVAEYAKAASMELGKLASAVTGNGTKADGSISANGGGASESASAGKENPFQRFLSKIFDGIKDIPKQFEGLFETVGKDALDAVLNPLKDAASGLLDNVFGGAFGSKDNKEKDGKAESSNETESVGDKITGKLKGVFDGLLGKFDGLFSGLGDTFKGLFSDLTGSLGSVFEGLLGNLGGLFSGGAGAGLGALFSSVGSLFGFAGGGRVQAGVPSVVGERGPELIVPSRASTVMNASDSRAAMGGVAGVSVNQTVNFDLVPSPTISAMIDAKKPEIEQAAIQGTLRALNRGGV